MRSIKLFGSLIGGLSLLVVAGASLWAVMNRQLVHDYILASTYEPTSSVAEIQQKLQLTNDGRFLFEASQPVLSTATEFNNQCSQHDETNSPILGCYVGNEIFIYDVTNQKLVGIEETTAAHELLHAVYQRLDSETRATIDQQLMAAYRRHKTSELEERMAYYEKTEPGEELNELHSILGTEIATLSTELEQHYARYFESRAAVVNYYETYRQVFDDVQQEIEQTVAAMNRITKQSNQRTAELNAAIEAFNRSGGSKAEYDALVARRNAVIAATNADTARWNALNRRYKQLTSEYEQLNRSINSSLPQAPVRPEPVQ